MRYDRMVEEALRGVVRNALDLARTSGLTGEHHFYLTFVSKHGGVSMPDYLREQYPDEMTIVLQHQFYDLDVDDKGFAVTLSFNSKRERLRVPFEAITTFADPSVNFALHFQKPSGGPPVKTEQTAESSEQNRQPEEKKPTVRSLEPQPPKLVEAVATSGKDSSGTSGEGEGSGKSPEKVVILDHFRNKES